MNKKTLKVAGVSKRYRAGKWIFRGIEREFRPGDAVLLSGPNGSGKTTFLKLLSVNTFPTSGSVVYGDLDIHRHPYRYLKNVGLVHDEESLPHYLTAVELLEWIVRSREAAGSGEKGGGTRETGGNGCCARVEELLDRLELDDARHELIGTYSTGMKKKVQIAAALIIEPEILVLDEPLRGLDRSATESALELFHQALERETILLMASHLRQADFRLFTSVMTFPLEESS